MELQYISDGAGNQTAVVIPIKDWNSITAKYEDLKDFENNKNTSNCKSAGFRGCISKETTLKKIADTDQSRSKSERNI